MRRPEQNEYAEYYHTYVSKVPDGDICDILEIQQSSTYGFLKGIDEEKANHRYAPGKWSIKEVIGHLADSERAFVYRALSFARNDAGPLPSFDENNFVKHGCFDRRSLQEIADEFRAIRQATILMFQSFDDDTTRKKGVANNVEFSVRALAYIIAGHERHHIGVIKERYLKLGV